MPAPNLLSSLAGLSFRGHDAREAVQNLEVGEELTIEREPSNQYHGNAVRVIAADVHVGYIERNVADTMAVWYDEGYDYRCIVDDIPADWRKPLLRLEPIAPEHT